MASAEMRKAQNKGVKGGTLRTGAKGKTVRKYDAKTGKWNVVGKTTAGKAGGRNYTMPKPSESKSKTATSAPGTFTASYARKTMAGGSPTVQTAASVANQRGREQRRMKIAAAKKSNAQRFIPGTTKTRKY